MNLFIRNFAAVPMTADNGNHVGGWFGAIQSLRSSIERLKCNHVICCWEGKGSAERRRKILKEYKEGRKFTGFNRKIHPDPERERESFKEQLIKLKMLFSYLPVNQLSVDYLEADDVIAYICKKILKDDYEKIILSTDRDYFQLVDEYTTIYRPTKSKKNPDGEHITQQHMIDELKCFPTNWILVKCAVGDSDNIEGVKNEAAEGKKSRGIGNNTFLKDFPFLVNQKDVDGEKTNFQIEDIIEFAKKQEHKKYKKYFTEESIELLKRNEKLIQLLDPNISFTSSINIEKVLEEQPIRLNPFKFRLELSSAEVSSRYIDTWLSTFSGITPLFNKSN